LQGRESKEKDEITKKVKKLHVEIIHRNIVRV